MLSILLSFQVDKYAVAANILAHAYGVYRNLCALLLRLRTGLCHCFNEFIALLNPHQQFHVGKYL